MVTSRDEVVLYSTPVLDSNHAVNDHSSIDPLTGSSPVSRLRGGKELRTGIPEIYTSELTASISTVAGRRRRPSQFEPTILFFWTQYLVCFFSLVRADVAALTDGIDNCEDCGRANPQDSLMLTKKSRTDRRIRRNGGPGKTSAKSKSPPLCPGLWSSRYCGGYWTWVEVKEGCW